MSTPGTAADDNPLIAQRLREMADLLDAEGANPYRAIAYRAAADTLLRLTRSVREIFDREGAAGLDALPARRAPVHRRHRRPRHAGRAPRGARA